MKFNETKSQERLINLMLQDGVEWPLKAAHASQDKDDLKVYFYNGKPIKDKGATYWCYGSDAGLLQIGESLLLFVSLLKQLGYSFFLSFFLSVFLSFFRLC